ncbi:hypothetical protein [Deinococcus sp. SL84]|uniref:hypothetical protein n=1 Tax=Deinococcus sp. SL84 TaxID=2994663 RepID=UPI002273E073|nr:hypothetical protein [Deinococcus sp. SL84]MCY1703651.1 hypothetical protein [Deinococcus sp. SL84]
MSEKSLSSARALLSRGRRLARSLRQSKAEWKARLGTRTNGGRQGRQVDSRARKRLWRNGRG